MEDVIREYLRMKSLPKLNTISSEWSDWRIKRPSHGPTEYELTDFRAAWVQKLAELEQGITVPVQTAAAPIQGVAALFQHITPPTQSIAAPIQSTVAPVQSVAAAAMAPPTPPLQQPVSATMSNLTLSNSPPANNDSDARSADLNTQPGPNDTQNDAEVDDADLDQNPPPTESVPIDMIDPRLFVIDYMQTYPEEARPSSPDSDAVATTEAANEPDPVTSNMSTSYQIGSNPGTDSGSTTAIQTTDEIGTSSTDAFQTHFYEQLVSMTPFNSPTLTATQGPFAEIDPELLSALYRMSLKPYIQDRDLLQELEQDTEDDFNDSAYPEL